MYVSLYLLVGLCFVMFRSGDVIKMLQSDHDIVMRPDGEAKFKFALAFILFMALLFWPICILMEIMQLLGGRD
jgi:hypothetical protein